MDEDHRSKLKEWMEDWYPEEFTENKSTTGCTVSREEDV